MAKKRVPAPVERKNRVMLSFNDRDFETLSQRAKEARLPTATYARLLIVGQLAPVAPRAKAG
jgi:hypothetical protein